jgi:hypothetical protein
MRILVFILAAVTLKGCAMAEDFGDAEQSVAVFHDRLNREVYEEIWELTAPAFREAEVRDDARALFSAMHSRLGAALASEKIDASFYASSNEGATVTLVYRTTFERGSATETFVFMVDSGKPLLWNYNISSDAFPGSRRAEHQRLAEST